MSTEQAARVQREVKIASQKVDRVPEVELAHGRFLRSTRANEKIHREATRWATQPSFRWTTGCGWKLGTSTEHEWMDADEMLVIQKKILGGVPVQSRMCEGGCDLEV